MPGAADDAVIRVKDLVVGFGDQIVLERINLEIASGTFLSVVGPSGAGKSRRQSRWPAMT